METAISASEELVLGLDIGRIIFIQFVLLNGMYTHNNPESNGYTYDHYFVDLFHGLFTNEMVVVLLNTAALFSCYI